TWLHWWWPVRSAKRLIISWVTSIGSLQSLNVSLIFDFRRSMSSNRICSTIMSSLGILPTPPAPANGRAGSGSFGGGSFSTPFGWNGAWPRSLSKGGTAAGGSSDGEHNVLRGAASSGTRPPRRTSGGGLRWRRRGREAAGTFFDPPRPLRPLPPG